MARSSGFRSSIRAPATATTTTTPLRFYSDATATTAEQPLAGEARIKQKLSDTFSPSKLQVMDVSGGCGSFYAINIASDSFKGLTTVKQHRLVNETLKEDIAGIHGLQNVFENSKVSNRCHFPPELTQISTPLLGDRERSSAEESLRGKQKRRKFLRYIKVLLPLLLFTFLFIVGALTLYKSWDVAKHPPTNALHPPTQPYAPDVQLSTPWTDDAVAGKGWQTHPRPTLYRNAWKTLNGIWTYSPAHAADDIAHPPFNQTLKRQVRIPACAESGMSGVGEDRSEWMWYKTRFDALEAGGSESKSETDTRDRHILHLDAVDYEAVVFVNGVQVAAHTGGYTRFSVDITEAMSVRADAEAHAHPHELIVWVRDPTDSLDENIPLGKQRTVDMHMFFASCSGIWQSVWLERVPREYITQVAVQGDQWGVVRGAIYTNSNDTAPVHLELHEQEQHSSRPLATHTVPSNTPFEWSVEGVSQWSVAHPHLYTLSIHTDTDTADSYLGFRSVSKGMVDGALKPLVNDEFIFTLATLDEGYWPDGLYTPPSEGALQYDIGYLKRLGFSGIRKHIKVEPDVFYYMCDKIGLLVWQDMPSLMHDRTPTDAQIAEFERQSVEIVRTHSHFPSIVTWVLYNEGWGQADGGVEEALVGKVLNVDKSRLIDAASGWKDNGFGDFHDTHHYSEPLCGLNVETSLVTPPDAHAHAHRIEVNMEMGGVGHLAPSQHNWFDMRTYKDTYEIAGDVQTWNFRTLSILRELKEQVLFTGRCAGAVYTQTSDIESEVNGLLSYDRRYSRPDVRRWREAIRGLYESSGSIYKVMT
ncbi:hypothetical protein E3P84_03406 [Wallemia ichthyophaga]|nr:hypothetical protein E3P84_03406 [Wallemia ichthyophaga]TIB39741.1 hypothetical protein E3P83_03306 [Wallemia ichthyophaga]